MAEFGLRHSHSGSLKLLRRLGFEYRKPKTLPHVADASPFAQRLKHIRAGRVAQADTAQQQTSDTIRERRQIVRRHHPHGRVLIVKCIAGLAPIQMHKRQCYRAARCDDPRAINPGRVQRRNDLATKRVT